MRGIGGHPNILSKDEQIVTAARMLMVDLMESQGGLSKATVTNPKYVTAEDKDALLERILDEYAAENSKAKTMPFNGILFCVPYRHPFGWFGLSESVERERDRRRQQEQENRPWQSKSVVESVMLKYDR